MTSDHGGADAKSGTDGMRAKVRELLDGFAACLGIGRPPHAAPAAVKADASTAMAQTRTEFARDRTAWAADRTLMGWIRTTLAMISFGFTIGKLGHALAGGQVKTLIGLRTVSVQSLAYFLVILGTLALLVAAVQYSRRMHMLVKSGLDRSFSLTFAIAIVLCFLGAFALTSLAMEI